MKAYDTITVNNNGQPFPDTRAVDSTGPLATDGTEIVKEVVDDVWLEKQALLDFYNYPPNGLDDLPGVDIFGLPKSQPLAAQYMNFATPGTIVNWPSEEDPAVLGAGLGIDIRLLLLHGQGILRADYRMLDSIVYIGDPDNATADAFYHADDAAGTIRDIFGDYLILPDARGYSFRALDPSGTIDPDGASRIVGSFQEDASQEFQADFHIMRSGLGVNNNVVFAFSGGFSVIENDIAMGVPTRVFDITSGGAQNLDKVLLDTSAISGQRTAIESRGKNIATHYAIHF